jgi:hypothetical protein
MPTISYFFGIYIVMQYEEHNPPHFHAIYGEYEASFEIGTWEVTGSFPRNATNMVLEWAKLHEAELLENWTLVEKRGKLNKIKPLD